MKTFSIDPNDQLIQVGSFCVTLRTANLRISDGNYSYYVSGISPTTAARIAELFMAHQELPQCVIPHSVEATGESPIEELKPL